MGKGIGIELSYDVAVIGGGAVGLGYAIRVKRDHPELRVLVLEKAREPRFKIGENTLSVTVEHLLELGFTMPQLRRLFTIKSGLGFWYADSATEELVSPVDVCNTEETFQVERRPMEIALTVLARSCGVEIRSGTAVSAGRSRLDGPDQVLSAAQSGAPGAEARFTAGWPATRAVLPRCWHVHGERTASRNTSTPMRTGRTSGKRRRRGYRAGTPR